MAVIVNSDKTMQFEGRFSMLQNGLTESGHTIVTGEDNVIGKLDKDRIQKKIRETLMAIDRKLMANKHEAAAKKQIKSIINDRLQEEKRNYSPLLHAQLFEYINAAMDEILGFGAIQPLLNDPDISDIFVNASGPGNIWYVKNGESLQAEVFYESDEQIMNIMEIIVGPIGRRIDESSPTVDARLPDGSRFHGSINPVALNGPQFTIRKFRKGLNLTDMVEKYKTITREDAEFFKACIMARLNIVVSGGTGSGKTSTLNVLSSFIPEGERIITIEDAAELQINAKNIIRYESRGPNADGKGAVTIRQLVKESLRERPQRIIIGEIRDAAALDMLQAMNTGHDGSLTTGHANTARDILQRLETMVLMAGEGLPLRAVRGQIASAVDIIIHQSRTEGGKIKVVEVISIESMNDRDEIVTKPILVYDSKQERLIPTGELPRFADKMKNINFKSAGVLVPKWINKWLKDGGS